MLIEIPNVLTPEQVVEGRKALEAADWTDGRLTAGHQGAKVKSNQQLHHSNPVAHKLGEMILRALYANPLFISAALPLQILPPMFNRYTGGGEFGTHVDGSIRQISDGLGGQKNLRTDLSCTLFFVDPDEYEGGELIIEDTYGTKSAKLKAGNMILYPSTSLHRVTPVTRGARLCSFFWLQSMIRGDQERTLLFQMDTAIQRLGAEAPESPAVVQLTGVYHNLLRKWAEV